MLSANSCSSPRLCCVFADVQTVVVYLTHIYKMDDGSSTSSSRFNDALQMLADWLSATETYLVEDQPVLGDLDTVTILVEKHKVSICVHKL